MLLSKPLLAKTWEEIVEALRSLMELMVLAVNLLFLALKTGFSSKRLEMSTPIKLSGQMNGFCTYSRVHEWLTTTTSMERKLNDKQTRGLTIMVKL